MKTAKSPSPSTTALRSLGQALLQQGQGLNGVLQTPAPSSAARAAQQADLQGALAMRDSELALLRRQLSQLTADFKFNLKLLEERDLELERLEAVQAGLREAAATKELALAEAQRLLAERDTALREKEGRVAVLEERQRQTMELCERQVAEARSSRDEEVGRCEAKCETLERQLAQRMATVEGIAAREKADIIAGYEKQVLTATAGEREARAAAQQAQAEGDLARSQLQRAEAKVAEQELAMQRMVSQFEGALQRLQQLEGQYAALAAESAATERAQAGRIQQLEAEVDSLRCSNDALQASNDALAVEQEGAVAGLAQQLQERERQLAEAKQRYHRTSLDNADLTETLSQLKQQLQQARSESQQAEGELRAARERCSQAQAALDRECSAHARTQGLLEATRLYLETAKREGEAQAQEAMRLREAAAVLEAQSCDAAQALEAAQTRLRAADDRVRLLGEQMEQERASHAEALASQEARLLTQAEHAIAAVQEEKSSLQHALELANRQLQQSYCDLETLRLQWDHARLAPPPPPSTTTVAATSETGLRHVPSRSLGTASHRQLPAQSAAPSRQQHQQHSGGSGGFLLPARYSGGDGGRAETPRHGVQLGASSGRYPDTSPRDAYHEVEAASSISGDSGDVFSDVADEGIDSARGMKRQGGLPRQRAAASRFAPPAAAAGAGAAGGLAPASQYQRQLHQHIDSLSAKLGSFERAVEWARHAGAQAAVQVVQSAEELPDSLQRRQVEVTERVLKKTLAREGDSYQKERQRLDEKLAVKERLLAEREQELQRLQKEREEEALRQKQAELQQREQELQQLARHLQQQQQEQRQPVGASVPASMAGSVPHSPTPPHIQAATAAVTASVAAASAMPPTQGQLAHRDAHASYPQRLEDAPGTASQQPAGAASAGWAAPGQAPQLRGPEQQGAAGTRQPCPMEGTAGLGSSAASSIRSSFQGPLAAAGGGALRSSLPSAQPGPGSSAVCAPPLPRLALGTALRQSTESLHTPRGAAVGAGAQPYRSGQAAALGPRVPGLSARPSPALAGAQGGGGAAGTAGGIAGVTGEDPLAKARRQVMQAKEYLRQVADIGGKLSRGGGPGAGAGASGGAS